MIPRVRTIVGGVLVLALCACGTRSRALEMTAILDVRSIQTAQTQYYSQFGRYAANLSELGTAQLIPASLASGQKGGYKFTMTATPSSFAVNASPTEYGETGRRTFYSDQTLAIHQNWSNEPASSSSPELK